MVVGVQHLIAAALHLSRFLLFEERLLRRAALVSLTSRSNFEQATAMAHDHSLHALVLALRILRGVRCSAVGSHELHHIFLVGLTPFIRD